MNKLIRNWLVVIGALLLGTLVCYAATTKYESTDTVAASNVLYGSSDSGSTITRVKVAADGTVATNALSLFNFTKSLVRVGSDVTLVNDATSPGNNKFYGTSGAGVKGFFDVPAGVVPGGLDTYVQYNDGGAFGGDAGFIFNETSGLVTVTKNQNTNADILRVVNPNTGVGAASVMAVQGDEMRGVFAVAGSGFAAAPPLDLANDVVITTDRIGGTTGGDIALITWNMDHTVLDYGNLQVSKHAAIGANANVDKMESTDINCPLVVAEEITDFTDYVYGQNNFLNLNPAADTSQQIIGIGNHIQTASGNTKDFTGMVMGMMNFLEHKGSGDLGSSFAMGLFSNIRNTGTGTIPFGIAGYFPLENWSTGVITSGAGVAAQVHNEGAGTIGTASAISVIPTTNNGTINNLYGLTIEDQSGIAVTDDANIWSKGANSKNNFEGKVNIGNDLAVETDTLFVKVSNDRVGINTAAPDATLDIESSGADDAELYLEKSGGVRIKMIADGSSGRIGTMFDSNFGITRYNATMINLTSQSNVDIGSGVAATDYSLTFNGESNDGSITWMEDENYFTISNKTIINSNLELHDLDAFSRPQIWFYPTNSFFRLGSNASDGDPAGDINSEGMVIWHPSDNRAARIKADRIGLTACSDSSLYYFRVDPTELFIKDASLVKTFGITRTSGDVYSTGNYQTASDKAFYFGDSATNGSWRLIRDGDNLVQQRREAGTWNTKFMAKP